MKIRKGDNVIIVTGKDKGKTGSVVKAFPKRGLIVVTGINVKKHHERARQSGKTGQIIEKSAPFAVSNAMLIDPKSKKGTRIGIKRNGKNRIRIATKGGAEI